MKSLEKKNSAENVLGELKKMEFNELEKFKKEKVLSDAELEQATGGGFLDDLSGVADDIGNEAKNIKQKIINETCPKGQSVRCLACDYLKRITREQDPSMPYMEILYCDKDYWLGYR